MASVQTADVRRGCKTPSRVRVLASSNGQVNPATVFVQFSNGVEGLNGETFVVTRTSGAAPLGIVPGSVGLELGPRVAVFTPTAPFASGAYQATVSGLTDKRGCRIPTFIFNFDVCTDNVDVESEKPLNGANTNTSISQNKATIVFKRPRKLVSFVLTSKILGVLPGTVSSEGSGTTFTFTPSGVVFPPVATVATVVVTDLSGACQQTFSWTWTAHV